MLVVDAILADVAGMIGIRRTVRVHTGMRGSVDIGGLSGVRHNFVPLNSNQLSNVHAAFAGAERPSASTNRIDVVAVRPAQVMFGSSPAI